ncbi:MAG: hypothetical protein PT118_18540 [Aphanizomenon gracile PMC644.10]|uniref:hypothetical protein n=1 Tax=Dolichospermum sp. UHCC 0352 TaxID=2590011 RepID=UPI00144887C2|nr:hypothetical protein [Dolichospermum sp. UHCC 0352]MDM3850735.1 hypothetical protein [Aphanizomenon gracile PMC627.10]MDM3861783.1 hypothetical protein [Aphanizomenon gracile PMC644.10]MTJ23076.1 hypothetical protein [Dolichospermum sp. UHCC 0352]
MHCEHLCCSCIARIYAKTFTITPYRTIKDAVGLHLLGYSDSIAYSNSSASSVNSYLLTEVPQ